MHDYEDSVADDDGRNIRTFSSSTSHNYSKNLQKICIAMAWYYKATNRRMG